MTLEERAQQIADGAPIQGPQTAPEIITAFERLLECERRAVDESRRAFEAGEILEEELYDGHPLIINGQYPLLAEARIAGKLYGAYVPVSIERLKEDFGSLNTNFIPLVREKLRQRVLEELRDRRERATAHSL